MLLCSIATYYIDTSLLIYLQYLPGTVSITSYSSSYNTITSQSKAITMRSKLLGSLAHVYWAESRELKALDKNKEVLDIERLS